MIAIKNHQKTLTIFGVLIILVVLTLLFFSWIDGPVSVSPAKTIQNNNQETEPVYKELTGKYFSTSIPNILAIKTQNQQPQGIRLEQILAVSQDSQISNKLAISIGTIPSEGLTSISDIQFRIGNNEAYKKIMIEAAPPDSLSFSNNTSNETSVFWAHNDKYASVVVSGAGSSQALVDRELSRILSQWQWK